MRLRRIFPLCYPEENIKIAKNSLRRLFPLCLAEENVQNSKNHFKDLSEKLKQALKNRTKELENIEKAGIEGKKASQILNENLELKHYFMWKPPAK